MKDDIAITAVAGRFPGAEGEVGVEGFHANIRLARRAKLRSLEQKWGISRSKYFHPDPGVPYRTYLDSAYLVSEQPGYSQLAGGCEVLRELFRSVDGRPLPPPSRIGLCLAAMWTDPGYFAEDWRRLSGERGNTTSSASALEPGAQVTALAKAVGIEGARLSLDTACASSLYALDAALGLIATGRSDAVALLGLNAYLPLFLFLGFAKLGALSPKAEILPFAADASGIIPSEAIAALLVEPAERAIRMGRTPLALIRGLGLSSDGGDRSVLAPSPDGQSLAYARAYRDIEPGSIAYVEAHGTATVLGDQTEIETLDRFFGPHNRADKLPIGSVKALIGHTLATAGMASIVKALLMLRERIIPPHVTVRPHPRIEGTCLRVPVVAEPWPVGKPRRMAISSFGFGGANAHLVLEAYTGREAMTQSHRVFLPVAIVAAEGTMGASHGCAELSRELANPTPAAQFPWERFSATADKKYSGSCSGTFFPASLMLESQGLRMGPASLARLDSFQRLGIHTIQQALRNGSASGLPETGVAFCTNLGGETSLRLSRHYQARLLSTPLESARFADAKPSVETITSSLTSLTSGYAAFHLGIRGFHETISGACGTFWESVGLSPYWLERRARTLILAAGRHVKSPLDLDSANQPGEGVAAFILKAEEECLRQGDTPLAVIRAVEFGADNERATLDDMCLRHAIPRDAVDWLEVSQIDQEYDSGERGLAQRAFGFLDEATGAETLLHCLLAKGTGWRVIEIRKGAHTLGHVLVEKLREFNPLPYKIAIPSPAEFQATPKRDRGETLAQFLRWQSATEAAMLSYVSAQDKLIRMLNGVSSPHPLPSVRALRRDEKNIVLEEPTTESGMISAHLKVDENHPYFFDHPLDHVPGILILEGILQLSELLMPKGNYVYGIDLSFRKFCEKDEPTLLRARPDGATGADYSIQVMQRGIQVANAQVRTSVTPPARETTTPRLAGESAVRRIPEAKYVHKLDARNVLITEMRDVIPGQLCSCDLLPPPKDHILDEGTATSHSLLYVLETTRQLVMTIAHLVEGVPLDMPMNLISIRLRLDQPVPRDTPLHFQCRRQPARWVGKTMLANIEMELHAPWGRIGETAIKAQVVDHDTYLKQRGLLVSQESHV